MIRTGKGCWKFAILMLVALLVVTCSDGKDQADLDGRRVCRSIGSQGGMAEIDGAISLDFPAGAITGDKEVMIVVEEHYEAEDLVEENDDILDKLKDEQENLLMPVSPVWDFRPEGTQFERDVMVEIYYDEAKAGDKELAVYFTLLGDRTVFEALNDAYIADGMASVNIQHFSLIFVGYKREAEIPPNDFNGTDIEDNPLVLLDSFTVGEENDGYNLDEERSPEGDVGPDNAMANTAIKDLIDTLISDRVAQGNYNLNGQILKMDKLPAEDETGYVDLAIFFGEELDRQKSNLGGDEYFPIEHSHLGDLHKTLFYVEDAFIETKSNGRSYISKEDFDLSFGTQASFYGNPFTVDLKHMAIEMVIQPSELRDGGIDLVSAKVGGIVACSSLAEEVDELGGIRPLSLVYEAVDIDLNEDGVLDRTDHAGNKDGITFAALFSGIPAYMVERESVADSAGIESDPSTEVTWVDIPGGTFMMGCSDGDEACFGYEKPLHEVTVPAFQMAATEITQAQYQATVSSNPSYFNDCPNCPVESVTFEEAELFCNSIGGRLPTEAEWEFAARGGSDQPLYDTEANAAWGKANSDMHIHPVAQKSPNGYNLYDMVGNVAEWVSDIWHGNYSGAPIDGTSWETDPKEYDGDETPRVERGGNYSCVSQKLRASYRYVHKRHHRVTYVGIRCVR